MDVEHRAELFHFMDPLQAFLTLHWGPQVKGIAGFDDGDEPVNFEQLAKQVGYLLTGSSPYFGKQVGWGTWPGIWGNGVSSRSTTTKVVILWELLFRVMWIVYSPCGLNVCYFTSSQPTLNFVFWRCQCNTESPITSLEIPLPPRTSTPPPPVPFALCRAWPSYVCVSLKHGWGGSEGLGNLAESFHQQVLKSHHHGDKGGCHYHGHSLVHHHQLPPFRARFPSAAPPTAGTRTGVSNVFSHADSAMTCLYSVISS